MKNAKRILKAEACALFIRDKRNNRLSLLVQEGYGELDKDYTSYDLTSEKDRRHITSWIYLTGEPVKIDFWRDFHGHPAYQRHFEGGKYNYALS